MSQTRPCVIPGPDNTTIRAKFHKFYTQAYIVHPSLMVGGHNGGQVSNELALIEMPDGSVESIPACNVRFTDVGLKIKLNDDQSAVEMIRKAVKANDGYCPCELHKTPDTKCMCKAFREQSYPGPCHCGLYTKVEGGPENG